MERLFTPGPVEIPERIREVLSRRIIHHRTKEFKESLLRTRELFKELVKTKTDNLALLTSSGTGAMECAVLSFFKEGDRVLVVEGGKFGQRWEEICKLHGLKTDVLRLRWGSSLNLEELEKALKRGEYRGVFLQMCESSTGAYNDVKEVGKILRERETLLVVDAITALGVYNIKVEEFGIDVLIGGSQKALMLPPGLSIIWFSQKAEKSLRTGSYYFNLKEEVKAQREGQTLFTPAINLVLALEESLKMLLERGMEEVERAYRTTARAMERAIRELNLKIFPEKPAISMTVVESERSEEIRRECLKLGVRFAGGQGKLKGKIFRISHMGQKPLDLIYALSSLELALKRLGLLKEVGLGVSTYLRELKGLYF